MPLIKKGLILCILALGIAPSVLLHESFAKPPAQEPAYDELPGYGKKCRIGEDYYFTYRFVQPPKMGTAILRVQLFDKSGQRITDLEVTGISGMPSMRGAHDSGDVAFQLNKKGDYLLPVNVVMAGEWEVKLRFLRAKKVIYLGIFRFHV